MKKRNWIEWIPFLSDKREDHCSDEDDLKKLAAELALQLKTDVKYHSMDDVIATMFLYEAKEILSQELHEIATKREGLASGIKERRKEILKAQARIARLRSLLR